VLGLSIEAAVVYLGVMALSRRGKRSFHGKVWLGQWLSVVMVIKLSEVAMVIKFKLVVASKGDCF
jgi:NO-binding membrane sensor protein with MHYT domain